MARRSGIDLTKGEFAKSKKEKTDLPLLRDVIDQSAEDIFNDVPDFHRQVKARLLKLGHTSQLIRETTLVPDKFLNRAGYPIRGLQDPATVAWNLATGLYYKTQPEPPWKLAHVRPGVCYIGLVFKMIPNDPREHACCAAQMFLNEGDAVVFRGANGPWKTGDFEFHLKAPEAKNLIAKVLDTFREKHGEPPKEFFIHGRTTFNDDEWNAFKEAAPKGTNLVGVRIKETHGESKLFRDGDYPVIRGTAIILDERNALVWTNGFVPRLDTYIGPETPNPLSITVLRSTGELPDIRTVLADIMGLTRSTTTPAITMTDYPSRYASRTRWATCSRWVQLVMRKSSRSNSMCSDPSLLPLPMRVGPAPRLTLRIAELLSVPAAAPPKKVWGTVTANLKFRGNFSL